MSLLSAFNAAPREGYLNDLYHIFGYLKLHASYCIALDPSLPNFDAEPAVLRDERNFMELKMSLYRRMHLSWMGG